MKHRVHASYIWLPSIMLVVAGIIVIVGLLTSPSDEADDGVRTLVILVCFIAYMLATIVWRVLSYRNLWYEFDEREFSLYSGIISKNHLHVPYARVQSVNHAASLFQRIVGVCSVSIDTAGGAANKAVAIPYVTTAAAEEIRRELFARKAGLAHETPAAPTAQATSSVAPNSLDGAFGSIGTARGIWGGEAVDTGEISYEVGLSNRQLLFTGISNGNSAFVGWLLVIVGSVLGCASPLIGSWIESLMDSGVLPNSFDSLMTFLTTMAIVFTIVAIIVFFLVGWIIGTISVCISYGNFRARRSGSRVEVERGLIQTHFSGIDIERVQSVVIKQSLIRRLLGYCELSLARVDAATQESQNKNQSSMHTKGLVIHPFVKLDEVPAILEGLVPELASFPVQITPQPKVALRRSIIRHCIWQSAPFWIAVCVALAQLVTCALIDPASPLFVAYAAQPASLALAISILGTICNIIYILCIVGTIWQAIKAVLWASDSGFCYDHDFLTIRNSGFATELVSIPRHRIQYGYTRRNPFQRAADVATIDAVTASGVGHTRIRLWDACSKDADAWLDWLKPRR